jgi:Protein of unknown function (DUF4233)
VNPGVRRLCAMVLVCEAIVIALAIPVAIAVAHADGKTAGIAGGVAAVVCLALSGLLRYRWAYVAGGVVQILVILGGFVVSTMFFLGAIFAGLWIAAVWLGRTVESG